MSMNYKIEKYTLKSSRERIKIVFDDDKYLLLSTFLQGDVLSFAEWIKKDFEKVISGECEIAEFVGNICFVQITPLVTRIYNSLIEDEEEYQASCCEVDTKALIMLIQEWCDIAKNKKETGVPWIHT